MQIATVLAVLSLLLTSVPALAQDERCPGTALEHSATLLSDMTPFKNAVRAADYSGRVVVRLTISEPGEVEDPKITFLAKLASDRKVIEEIRAWRFCPAVKYSRYQSVSVEFHIEVRKDPR